MLSKIGKIGTLVIGFTISASAIAAPTASKQSLLLHSNFQAITRGTKASQYGHFLLDSNLSKMSSADSLNMALEISKSSTWLNISQETQKAPITSKSDINMNGHLTIVIVPGIFGEFIKTRPFEEVFKRESSANKSFKTAVAQAKSRSSKSVQDSYWSMETYSDKEVSLDEVMDVGSIDREDGTEWIRLVLIKNKFMSTESIGDTSQRAALFNRRLQKYVDLTGEQNLVLLGYSRGTSFGLDMLSQAQVQNLPFLKNVKGFVSYAGVVFGSSLADTIDKKGSDNQVLLAGLKQLSSNLELVPNEEILGAQNWIQAKLSIDPSVMKKVKENDDVAKRNTARWAQFMTIVALQNFKQGLKNGLNNKPLDASAIQSIQANLKTDLSALKDLAQLAASKWDLTPAGLTGDYNQNIKKFKKLIEDVITGVTQLSSKERQNWWANHQVPTSLTYYSLPAVMVNQENGSVEKEIYEAQVGYNGSPDDVGLLKNQKQYVQESGLHLNDSQVSIAQASFINGAIRNFNPKQPPIKTVDLGILGTHHWGITLQVVQETKDKAVNPFPREDLIKALGATLIEDLQLK